MGDVDALCGNIITPFYILAIGIIFSFCLRIIVLYEYWVPFVSFIAKWLCCNCIWYSYCKSKCCKCCKKKSKHEQLPKEIKIGFGLSEGRKDSIELAIACNYRLINNKYYESVDSQNTFDEKVIIYHDNRSYFNCWAVTFESLQGKINIAKGFSNKSRMVDKLYDSKWKIAQSEWEKIDQNELIQRKSDTPYYEIRHEEHTRDILGLIRNKKEETKQSDDGDFDFDVIKTEIFAEHKELEIIDGKLQRYHEQGISDFVELNVAKCPILSSLNINDLVELSQASDCFDFIQADIAYFNKIIENYDEYEHWTPLLKRLISHNLSQYGYLSGVYSSPLCPTDVPSHYEYMNSELDLKLKVSFLGWNSNTYGLLSQANEAIEVSGLLFFDSGGHKIAEDCNESLSIAKSVKDEWFINTQTWDGKDIDISLYKNRNYKRILKKSVLLFYMFALFVLSVYQWYLDIVDMSNRMGELDSGWNKYQCMNWILMNSPNIKTFIVTIALLRNLSKLKKYPLWLNVILIGEKGVIIVALTGCLITHIVFGSLFFGMAMVAAWFVIIFIMFGIGYLLRKVIKLYFQRNLEIKQMLVLSIQPQLDRIKNNEDIREIFEGLLFVILYIVIYFWNLSALSMITKYYSGEEWETAFAETFVERKTENFINDFEENLASDKDRLFEFIFRFI